MDTAIVLGYLTIAAMAGAVAMIAAGLGMALAGTLASQRFPSLLRTGLTVAFIGAALGIAAAAGNHFFSTLGISGGPPPSA